MKARRVVKGCAVLPLLGVLGIGALFGALSLEHRRETTLPAPTGPFAVGRVELGVGRRFGDRARAGGLDLGIRRRAGRPPRRRPTTCPLPCARRSSARAAR